MHQPVRSERVGELPRQQKLGIEQKERLTGSREREQGKGDKAQSPFRRNREA